MEQVVQGHTHTRARARARARALESSTSHGSRTCQVKLSEYLLATLTHRLSCEPSSGLKPLARVGRPQPAGIAGLPCSKFTTLHLHTTLRANPIHGDRLRLANLSPFTVMNPQRQGESLAMRLQYFVPNFLRSIVGGKLLRTGSEPTNAPRKASLASTCSCLINSTCASLCFFLSEPKLIMDLSIFFYPSSECGCFLQVALRTSDMKTTMRPGSGSMV